MVALEALLTLLRAILVATAEVFIETSPYLLLGLGMAGVVHVLVRTGSIARWMGRPGLGSIAAGAGLGVPLPLCSCSVVPVTIELARKGASREASLAFLVSTPETGVDSIVVTWALLGPVMAVTRPLAALATGIAAGLASLLARRWAPPPATPAGPPAPVEPVSAKPLWSERFRRGLRYGFVEMVDEIGFWLIIGFVLTGLISALLPDDLLSGGAGGGPLAMIALLLLGIPLYMCATASTPIAAALLLKGVSPGAALVFLLSGPATNASSLVLIARFFGRSFVRIYLASIAVVALLSGFTLDVVCAAWGLEVLPRIDGDAIEGRSALTWASAAILLALLAWRLPLGAWKMGWSEFRENLVRLVTFWTRRDGNRGNGDKRDGGERGPSAGSADKG